MQKKHAAWGEGFNAGNMFSSQCPYPNETEEAREWEVGWIEGVLSRTIGVGEHQKDLEQQPIPEFIPELSGWRRLFRRLRKCE
jgi:hypothetical protein